MLRKIIGIFILVFWIGSVACSQERLRIINWDDGQLIDHARAFKQLPVYSENIPLDYFSGAAKVNLLNLQFQETSEFESEIFKSLLLNTKIDIESEVKYSDQKAFLYYQLVPLRINTVNGKIEKLISFDIEIQMKPKVADTKDFSYKNISVLATGRWFKIKLAEDGIYKITRNDLISMGVDVSILDPRNIRIYGNGGGMLPEKNSETRFDDLVENAIQVIGESDGKFDADDYLFFYGQSPHIWQFNKTLKTYTHIINAYSDYTYYFLNYDLGPGKRIVKQESLNIEPSFITDEFEDHVYHELEENNLINSGRNWYGEVFDANTNRSFNFNFPDIVNGKQVSYQIEVAARSSLVSQFSATINGSSIRNLVVQGINFSLPYPPYAQTSSEKGSFNASGDQLNLTLNYNKPNPASIGWLDKIELTAWRKIIFHGNQLRFRNSESVFEGGVTKFVLSGADDRTKIWNVSDPLNPIEIDAERKGTSLEIIAATDSLIEFVAFEASNVLSPEFVEEIENQNYHGAEAVDLIIVSPDEFYEQALRLGEYHLMQDGLSYLIAKPAEIYNEFSSGAQDVSAIRNFIRMLYDKAPSGSKPGYLLLFGDASFDYKNRIDGNTNFVPTWEFESSTSIIVSYNTDDYFGLLDENEGVGVNGSLDIGIGRIPVKTIEQARQMVDKILHYAGDSDEVMGSWRNKICLVADDQDYNAYINDSEKIASIVESGFSNVNLEKIYFDAYPQISTPGGQRYPDVKKAINEKIEQGTVLINYIGHGGETGWAHERVLEIQDINAWQNMDRLPVFVTATCEFTRFDNPELESAGELVLLNDKGGGIALLTTTRATSAGANYQLNQQVVKNIFRKSGGQYLRLGDIIKNAKNAIGNGANAQKFVLVGDPALKIALPEDSISTLRINEQQIQTTPDTIAAMANVSVSGSVYKNGIKDENFNGLLFPIVYDKKTRIKTFGQDADSFEQEFGVQTNILYKGKVSVSKGDFRFSFVVPRDIAYNYGFGKISYYAKTAESDAWGSYDNLIVGGYNNELLTDTEGPQIKLFLNDASFENGDVANTKPIIYAQITDQSGINTTGNGIGHDIVAVLGGDTEQSMILNDFFEFDLDSHKSGTINYQLSKLEEGDHSLSLKVWDILNNSSEASISFKVIDINNIFINEVMNFPNPFRNNTWFRFKHNQAQSKINLEIQIYSLSGEKVSSIFRIIEPGGYSSGDIYWNATSDSGERLKSGIYIYRLLINGKLTGDTSVSKLIILN